MKITASIEKQTALSRLREQEQLREAALPVPEFVAGLLNAVTVLHMMHLQTRSFAQHNALSFYEDLGDMADKFTEEYQGFYGLIQNYPTQPVTNVKEPVAFVTELHNMVETLRRAPGFPQDSCLQNTVDEIAGGIAKTMYKLKFLA